jgi:predicted ATP-dependent serine protease
MSDELKKQLDEYYKTEEQEAFSLWAEPIWKIMETEFPKAEPLIDGLLYSGDQALIFGKAGSGKSYITQKLMLCLAMGKDFGFYNIRNPKRILYVDGEMPPEAIQSRFRKMRKNLTEEEWQRGHENLLYVSRFICPQDIPDAMLRTLDEERNMNQLIKTIERNNIDVLVIDNIFTCYAFEDYSSPTEWIAHVNPLLNYCRKNNITCWIVDHANKNQTLFGTMSKTVTLDLLIKLESERKEFDVLDDTDHDNEPEFSFKFEFEKARRLTSAQQQPTEFELRNGDVLTREDPARIQVALAKKYYEQGLSYREIQAKIMEEANYNCSHMKIQRWAKREEWERL